MFRVCAISGKGRGAVAVGEIAPGTVVLSCEPLFALLCDNDSTCAWCFADSDPYGPPYRRKCERCGIARYCSDRCRELARSAHEADECTVVAAVAALGEREEDIVEDVLSVALVETLRKRGKSASFDEELCWAEQLDKGRLKRVAETSARVLGHIVEPERAQAIVGKIASNSFGLDTPMREGEFNESGERDVNFLGRVVYVEASFFNHTCDAPNVVRVRAGRRIHFLAGRAIADGEELCITYINSARHADNVERQAKLFEYYAFHCNCGVCDGSVPSQTRMCERCGCCEFFGHQKYEWCCVCDAQKIEEFF